MSEVGGGVRKCWNCGQPTTDKDLRVCNDPICGQAAISLRERTIGQEQLHRRYREYQREYDKRPEVKTKVLERSRTPENRAKQREYRERHKKSSLSAEDDLPDWVDHFLPGPNINPHDDPAYDEPYVKCESSYSCPDPARTGPFNFSGGYIGKITACRECWQAILEMYEEEYQEGIVQHVGTAWQNEWAAEGDDRSVPRNWDLIMSDPHADMGLYPNGQPRLPPLDDIPVAESLDDLRNIFSGFGADELHTGGDNKLAIIGFPLTAYRGVASDVHWMGDTGGRYDYLSTLDGGVIGGRCGGLAVLGNNSNTPPVSIDLSVALDFAIGRKSSIASLPPDYGIQLSKPITYSIDLQDYLVQNIRLDSDESSLGVPGGNPYRRWRSH